MADRRNTKHYDRAYGAPYKRHVYNNSSSAYDYDYEQAIPEPGVRKKKVRRVKRGTREVYIKATDKAARPSILVYAAMLIIASGITLGVVSHSFVTTQNLKNQKLRNELKSMQSRTAELIVETTQSMDLENIERIARTRLEMSEPQAHQIVHINVPRINYTVHLEETEEVVYSRADSGIISLAGLKKLFAKE